MSTPVLIKDAFLAPEACQMLVEGFERNAARIDQRAQDPYWRDRLLYYNAIPHEAEMRRVMREARALIVREIEGFYSVGAPLYSDTVHLVRWREGQLMVPHADNCEPDGRPNAYPWREFASLVYLNDDYEGGEIYFERVGVRIKPRTGLLLAFKGGLEHTHGVDRVLRGTRYTMPAWHTRDASRRDRDFDERSAATVR